MLGTLYELRARTAIVERNQSEFVRFSALCREQYRPDRVPALAAKFQRLHWDAERAGIAQTHSAAPVDGETRFRHAPHHGDHGTQPNDGMRGHQDAQPNAFSRFSPSRSPRRLRSCTGSSMAAFNYWEPCRGQHRPTASAGWCKSTSSPKPSSTTPTP